MIDTHTHLDGEEYNDDRLLTIERAREAGITRMYLPAIDVLSCHRILALCEEHPDYLFPMIGLHPEEVKADWQEQLSLMRPLLKDAVAVGEVGLDFYWSREFEQEQLLAFEEQVRWSVETGLPLMIHCRKGQHEMVRILRKYEKDLPGGVFHCFTGNAIEARELLTFERFVLGIGGVLTFKKSNLPDTLREAVPLNRIVLETDAPYMAPVPKRGTRNESAFVPYIAEKLAEVYGVSLSEVDEVTTATALRVLSAQ